MSKTGLHVHEKEIPRKQDIDMTRGISSLCLFLPPSRKHTKHGMQTPHIFLDMSSVEDDGEIQFLPYSSRLPYVGR